jgi:Ca-activated chloride channel homolog
VPRWLTFVLFGFLRAAAQPQEPGAFQISVDVNLVVIQATVADRHGHFLPDLTARDFEIYEDGVRQSVRLFRHEDIPVTVGLVIDHSGSMRTKLTEVIAAARTFVQASNPQDQMFTVNFNDHVDVPLTRGSLFVSRPGDLEHAINVDQAAGMTKLYDAVVEAQQQLRTCTMEKKILIVISDGGDNASAHTLADVVRSSESSPALIYTIGIFDDSNTDGNKSVLRRLARSTGGEAFFPPQLDSTVDICRQIARDIRNQYTLGYVSTNLVQNNAVRAIRVVASAPGHGKVSVRTRTGYIANSK